MERLRQAEELRATLLAQQIFDEALLIQLRSYYRVALTWSSTGLDGNSLTEQETRMVLEDKMSVAGRPLRHLYETVGHGRACDGMFSLMDRQTLKEADILALHRQLCQGLDLGPAGQYRQVRVCYAGSRYPVAEPEKIPEAVSRLCAWIAEARNRLHPVAFAAVLHARLLFIAPFQRGNGQVARLFMHAALLQSGYLPAVIAPELRSEYQTLLERARLDENPLVDFLAQREIETQEQLLELLDGPSPEEGPDMAQR